MKCPFCGSIHNKTKRCWDCNGTGISFWVATEECGVCDGLGELYGEYECLDCGMEWIGIEE